MEELIQLKEIKKYFPWKKRKYVKAVDSVSLSIKKRDIFGLVGESGSGKTTLGRMMIHLIDPTSGSIFYKGEEISKAKKIDKELRRNMQIVAEILNLLKKLREEFDLTYIFITHDLYLARIITEKIAIMYLGKIMEYGDTESIFKNPLHPYTEALFSVIPKLDPKKRVEKIVLKGEIPSPVDPPLGCRFHTRCVKKIGEICEKVSPSLKEIEEKHFVSCHLYE